MNNYNIDNERLYFNCVGSVASEIGAIWSNSKKQFFIDVTLERLLELEQITHDTDLRPLIKKLEAKRTESFKAKHRKSELEPRLRDYQKQDLNFINQLDNPAIFSSPRTGKTPLALLSCKAREFKKILIVVPASLVLVWKEEVSKWLDDKEAYVLMGTAKKRKAVRDELRLSDEWIAIISYDTLKADVAMFTFKFDCFILDEGHFLRNAKTKRSKAVKQVSRLADHRYCLTGTPAVRHASDVWYLLNFLYPSIFTSYWNFVGQYFNMELDYFSGHEVPTKLKDNRKNAFVNLVNDYCVQRKLQDVITWLPPVIRYPIIRLPFGKKQEKYYQEMTDTFVVETDEAMVDSSNVLVQKIRLRQLALEPKLLGFTDAESPKTEWLKQYLTDNPDEPVIVFSMFTSYLKLLHEQLPDTCLVTGEQSAVEKQKAIADFQNGVYNVILVNIQAGGTGITLDRGQTAIFTDFGWTPELKEQAEARFLPTTPDKDHVRGIYYLFMEHSVDDYMFNNVKDKAQSVNYVNELKLAQRYLSMKGDLV